MYARVITLTGVNDVDAAVAFLQDSLSTVGAQRGYQGMTAGIDRSSGVMGILSLWESEADREASNSALAKIREDAGSRIASSLNVETFEERVVDMSRPPQLGARLMVTRISMDPAKVDETLGHFQREILPQIKAAPGYLALRSMINPDTGEGIVGSVWSDDQSLEAAADAAMSRRPDATARGVNFGDTSYREVIFMDMP
jgi:heme-degrading monooxygenase HmoA